MTTLPLNNDDLHSFCLCEDCYVLALGEGKQLPKTIQDEPKWMFGSDNDLEPHFIKRGDCDGCDTMLGGNRYDVWGWQRDTAREAWASRM